MCERVTLQAESVQAAGVVPAPPEAVRAEQMAGRTACRSGHRRPRAATAPTRRWLGHGPSRPASL